MNRYSALSIAHEVSLASKDVPSKFPLRQEPSKGSVCLNSHSTGYRRCIGHTRHLKPGTLGYFQEFLMVTQDLGGSIPGSDDRLALGKRPLKKNTPRAWKEWAIPHGKRALKNKHCLM